MPSRPLLFLVANMLTALAAAAWSQEGVDLFLLDDYSTDPEELGYRVVAPPATMESMLFQRWQGRSDDLATELSAGVHTRLSHPITEHLAFDLEAEVAIHLPNRPSQFASERPTFAADFEQALLRHDRNRWTSRAGLQIMSWGAIPGAGVLDVISPRALAVDENIDRISVPQLSLMSSVEFGDQTLQAFLTPDPAMAPEVNSALDQWPVSAPEVGVQLLRRGPRAGITANLARLVPDTPVRPDPGSPDTSREAYWLAGISGRLPVGHTEWLAELAYKSDLTPSNSPTAADPIPDALAGSRERVDGALGVQFDSPVYGHWTGYINLVWWPDDNGLPAGEIWRSDMAVSWQESAFSERLHITLTGYSSLTEPVFVGVALGRWSFSERSDAGLRTTYYSAAEDTAFADLNRDLGFMADWRYYF